MQLLLLDFQKGSTATGTNSYSTNTWYHCALVLTGTDSWKVYTNGRLETTLSRGFSFSSTTDLWIGGYTNAQQMKNGYIDEFRISNIARYTDSSYTIPTSAFVEDENTIFLNHFDNAF